MKNNNIGKIKTLKLLVCIMLLLLTLSATAETATLIQYTYDSNGNLLSVYARDLTPPILTQVTPVPTPTYNQNPPYTFNSTEAGTITYGGSCAGTTTVAATGNNTILLGQYPGRP